ncbi:MAG: hypothetical protein ACREFD_15315 [Stellaceae bacterium]
MTIGRNWRWVVTLLLTGFVAACQAPQAPGRHGDAVAVAPKPPLLSPGCPLGAVSVEGLNPVQNGCAASPQTRPPGPIGTANLQ